MKSLLVFVFMLFSTVVYSQGIKIDWEDNQGREFVISAPSCSFSYGMVQGDNVGYDLQGRVNKVGSVYISYDLQGRVNKVGNLYIRYDLNGRITGTSGSVN